MSEMSRPRAATADEALQLEDQLTAFFGAHYDRLIRLATLVCHNAAQVEDAVQAAREQAGRRPQTLRDPDRIRPWLDRIVVRESIRVNRRPWWAALRTADDTETAAIPDHRSDVNPAWLAVSTAMRELPAEQRAAVALHLYAGYSVEETAQIMGASTETTRSRLRLARNRLRRQLDDEVPS